MDVLKIQGAKNEKRKLTMLTCYDAWTARLLAQTDLDIFLVGDSAAMVVHGFDTTLAATTEMMSLHTAAVRRGAPRAFLVADMPFLSFRRGVNEALDCVDALMKAGANAVKLEGVRGHEEIVESIVGSGIPVMGHLGLTPQSVHALGGFRVQGREERAAEALMRDARRLEELGCFSLVLECVPSLLAARVTTELRIPTLGIGAGADCDGQVLVLQDMLGMNSAFRPKFVRTFQDGEKSVRDCTQAFVNAVRAGSFPNASESYT